MADMFEYSFPISGWQEGWELQFVAGKIYNALDTAPAEGLFDGQMTFTGDSMIVYFYRELTVDEMNTLTTAMSQPNIGAFPDITGKIVVEIPDYLRDWKALETALGIDIAFAGINPYTGRIYLIVNSVPNSTKKTALKNAMWSQVSITRNGLPV